MAGAVEHSDNTSSDNTQGLPSPLDAPSSTSLTDSGRVGRPTPSRGSSFFSASIPFFSRRNTSDSSSNESTGPSTPRINSPSRSRIFMWRRNSNDSVQTTEELYGKYMANPSKVQPFRKLRAISKNDRAKTLVVEQIDETFKVHGVGQRFCLKVVRKNSLDDPERQKAVLNELKVYQRLEEDRYVIGLPLIMDLLGFFEDKENPGTFFFTFPLLQCNFEQVIREGHMFDCKDKARYFSVGKDKKRWLAQIATGIHALHQRGIIHRNLQPRNILLDNQGNAVITDFEMAYLSSLPGSAHYNGGYVKRYVKSSNYIAPEGLRYRYFVGGTYGSPVDWWALGCIAYELEKRERLFGSHSEIKSFAALEQGRYRYLSDVKGLGMGRAGSVIGGLLNPDSAERYGFKELCADPYFIVENGNELHYTVERALEGRFSNLEGCLRVSKATSTHQRLYVPVVKPSTDSSSETLLEIYRWVNPSSGYWD